MLNLWHPLSLSLTISFSHRVTGLDWEDFVENEATQVSFLMLSDCWNSILTISNTSAPKEDEWPFIVNSVTCVRSFCQITWCCWLVIRFLQLVVSFAFSVSDSVSCEIRHLKLLRREAPEEHLDQVCLKNRPNLTSTWKAGVSGERLCAFAFLESRLPHSCMFSSCL